MNDMTSKPVLSFGVVSEFELCSVSSLGWVCLVHVSAGVSLPEMGLADYCLAMHMALLSRQYIELEVNYMICLVSSGSIVGS